MKKKWGYLIGGLIAAIVVTSIVVPVTLHFLTKKDNVIEQKPDAVIVIMNDWDFKNYNFTGEGSESNPYVIENYNITTTKDYAIYISSTSKYFIIRNCNLAANFTGIYIKNIAYGTAMITRNICNNHKYYGIYSTDSSGVLISRNFCYNNTLYGIYLSDCSDFIVDNNTCNNSCLGIYLSYSNNITLTNNIYNNNFYAGIELDFSANVALTNNTCNDNFYKGIRLEASDKAILTNNTCNDNMVGFNLLYSNSAKITNNTCSNNFLSGIRLRFSNNSWLTNNNFYDCGLSIWHNTKEDYFSHTVENNYVNDKKLGYFINSSSSTISNPIYGQLILVNCLDMIISNQEFCNTTVGLTLKYCENLTLINNYCNNCEFGIILESTSSSTLINNTCENNWDGGITLSSSKNISLTNNTCNNNDHDGISLYYSPYTILTNNTCNNNEYAGVQLRYSKNVTLNENTINNNDYAGIQMTSSNNTFLTNNRINNNWLGLNSRSSDHCLIIFNSFGENTNYAISIHYEADYNIIHHNSFIDNNPGGTSQAEDEWMNNIWYDTTTNEGNYWSDWIGSGDYEIDGNANAVDPYPLSSPPVS